MAITNPDKVVTKQDLADFYDKIFPYLGGMPEMVANQFGRSDIFSTTEKMIGQWIDGKPLYQKVFTTTMPTTTTDGTVATSYLATGATIDTVVKAHGVLNSSNMYITLDSSAPTPSTSIKYGRCIAYSNVHSSDNKNKIRLDNAVGTWSGVPVTIILQYTKTTDSATSIGVDTDYSTTEKIVGTWIDGKPLYQKTIQTTTPIVTTDDTLVTKDVDPSVNNLESLVYLTGFTKTASNGCILVNGGLSASGKAYSLIAYLGSTGVIKLTCDRASLSDLPCYITIQYTKTT